MGQGGGEDDSLGYLFWAVALGGKWARGKFDDGRVVGGMGMWKGKVNLAK
jgi:hypothetical protein